MGRRSDGDEGGRFDSLGAQDDADGSEGQRASTPKRWDSSEERLPTMRKTKPTRESQKSLHLVSVRTATKCVTMKTQ